MGKKLIEYFIPDNRMKQIQNILSSLCEEGESELIPSVEFEIVTKNGKRLMICWTNTTLRGLDGNISGACLMGKESVSLSEISGFLSNSSLFSGNHAKNGRKNEPTENLMKLGNYCYIDNDPNERVKIGLHVVFFFFFLEEKNDCFVDLTSIFFFLAYKRKSCN